MKRYLIGSVALLALAAGVFAGSHEGEFMWHKVTGPGPYHVDVVSGHGKTCYVFTEEYEKETLGNSRYYFGANPASRSNRRVVHASALDFSAAVIAALRSGRCTNSRIALSPT